MTLKVKFDNYRCDLKPPAKKGDAGFDIFAPNTVIIEPRSSVLVKTGVHIQLPEGYYGRICSRSGLSIKNKVEVGAGTIDTGYRGSLDVHLYNHSDEQVTIPANKAIAQLVVSPYIVPEIEHCCFLEESERAESGFGSTDAISP